jgi:2-methylfumaryl-CoA isomerase
MTVGQRSRWRDQTSGPLQEGTSGDDASPSDGPLAGLRIIEISSYVAAPLGGMTLAQLGADVIRIDPIGGAPDRTRWPLASSGASLYWAGLNKGKRSVMLDLRTSSGRDLAARLVVESGAGGGVLLTNALGASQLSYEELCAARPDVIVVRVQGSRTGGPAVDYTVNAGIGFPLVTGPEGHAEPVNHVLPAWDIACGLYAAIGILAAERRRQRTGRGALVTVPLYDVALATAGNLGLLAEGQLNKVRREPIGNHLYGAFGRDFSTKDGRRVMVVALTDRHWRELSAVTGLADTFTAIERALGATFATDEGRFHNREIIASLLQPWFASRTLAEVSDALSAVALPWSPYRTFADMVGEGLPDLIGNPMMAEVDQSDVGRHLAPGCPVDVLGFAREVAPAPRLGQDTNTVLSAILGLSDAELADLRQRHVVAGAT